MWNRAKFLLSNLSLLHWIVAAGLPLMGGALVRLSDLSPLWQVAFWTGALMTIGGLVLLRMNATTPWPRVVGWSVSETRVPKIENVVTQGQPGMQQRVREFPMEIAFIDVANDPPGHHPTAVLRGGTVTMAYLHEAGGEPFQIVTGAWGTPPHERRSSRMLLPNGEPHRIPVVIRHSGEPDCYAAVPSLWESADIRLPGQRIPERSFFVRVAIGGTGLAEKKRETIRVVNEPGAPLRIELLHVTRDALAPTSRSGNVE